MDREALLRAVWDAHGAGISVFPPREDGSKAPDPSWKGSKTERTTSLHIETWYANGRTGIGWACGKVSNNLEVLDFDDRGTYEKYVKAAHDAGLGELVERIENGYLEHTPRGVHWPYYCPETKTKDLAVRKEGGTLIETRGEGSFVIVAPTHGNVNPYGDYVLKKGDVHTIARITQEERGALHSLAAMFNESTIPTVEPFVASTSWDNPEDRPGDQFAQRTSWAEVLEPWGWKLQKEFSGKCYWTRPGKQHGHSATTNYNGNDLFHVFSSSVPGFTVNKSYSKFYAYSILEHGGDYQAAAKELRTKGFGGERHVADVDISAILEQTKQKLKEPKPFPKELLDVPGLVGDLVRHIDERSKRPQPILALGAAIAAMGTVIGRKVMTREGLRSNIYVIGVGASGCGKEEARQVIKDLFTEIGEPKKALMGTVSSDAAILKQLEKSPATLFGWDEIGQFFRTLFSARAQHYQTAIIRTLMELYSASRGSYDKGYADDNNDISIDQPCLSLYGSTVPGNLFRSMSSEQIHDGFMSRLLIFQSEEARPKRRRVDVMPLPSNIVEGFKFWNERKTGGTQGNLAPYTTNVPLMVGMSRGATKVFDQCEIDNDKLLNESASKGEEAGIYTRVAEAAEKLALIRACGINLEHPEISEADALWAVRLAKFLTDNFVGQVTEHVADDEYENKRKKILQLMVRDGGHTVARHAIMKKSKYSKRDFDEAINTLLESGAIAKSSGENEAAGRRGVLYTIVQ